MPFVAGGDEGGILHHLYKGPDAMPRGALGGTSGPLMIERPISAVEAIALPSSETLTDSGPFAGRVEPTESVDSGRSPALR